MNKQYSTYVSRNENLNQIKPVLDKALESFLGVKIDKISNEILEKLVKNNLNIDFLDSWSLEEAKFNFKKDYLIKVLREFNGNISKASTISGIDRRTIHRLIIQFNIDIEEFRNLPYHFSKKKIDDYIKFVAGDVLKQYSLTEKKSELIYGLPTDELVKVIKKPFPKMEDAYDFFEYKFLVAVILKNDKVLKDVCKQLKIARETLSRKISKHKINIKDLNMDFKENNIKLEELI
ncbi:hypothetical protein HOK68_01540 [Candidatus Woesearchaeota archaeon]|jgi:DNA-binding NtrC family response regulator|nr:hypothetical protein [Candidatus Woesearchaeota archaeon]MBT4388014.1 hypothetical protein [Candidatus Woesearchaeota archaeon]MBT4596279.1 hypothetical protein [Candidatus Woesearchaeota archaeon]MBT5740781.1 hypothetical protein [Candidatus Woesearchaeota archaeon]MBT6505444.1 hypothetical protein [Candidatus Woesearchaeota archaeon]